MDRLKKDMMTKLESVAAEFRKASHAQMSATTQRTIRENVNLSAQVMQLSEKAADLSKENDLLQGRNTDQRRRIEMLENEQSQMVRRNTYRLKVIYQSLTLIMDSWITLRMSSGHQRAEREVQKSGGPTCRIESVLQREEKLSKQDQGFGICHRRSQQETWLFYRDYQGEGGFHHGYQS